MAGKIFLMEFEFPAKKEISRMTIAEILYKFCKKCKVDNVFESLAIPTISLVL
jgi:hypothetical protein